MKDMGEELPKGIALTVLREHYKSNPYAILERIRQATPLHHDDELNQYIATHHNDVKLILRDKDYRSGQKTFSPSFPALTGKGLSQISLKPRISYWMPESR